MNTKRSERIAHQWCNSPGHITGLVEGGEKSLAELLEHEKVMLLENVRRIIEEETEWMGEYCTTKGKLLKRLESL